MSRATQKALEALRSDSIEAFDNLFAHKIHKSVIGLRVELKRRRNQVQEYEKSQNAQFGRVFPVTARFVAKLITSDMRVLHAFLPDAEKIALQAWRAQGNEVTPDFIRGLLSFKLCGYVTTLHEVTVTEITAWKQRWRLSENDARSLLRHLEGKCAEEFALIQNSCEAKAIELECEKRVSSESRGKESGVLQSNDQRRRVRGLSPFTRAVRKAFVNAPRASGLEICRSIDEDGVDPTPRMNSRSYEDTYQNDRGAAKRTRQ